ncbi:MAG: glycosyltransferase family 2 protein, partial [Vicinamibacterales bacterium]
LSAPLIDGDRPQVSVVIVSWNTRELLRACLRSMRQAARELNDSLEVVVVDNASHDGSVEMVREEFPEVDVVGNTSNVGFAAANNQGIPRTRGQYVLLLNPDTEGTPGFLATLVGYLDAHPEVGAVGPRVRGSQGELQVSCYPLPTVGREMWRLLHLDRIRAFGTYPATLFDAAAPQRVEAILGACLLVRRAALEGTGLLDEQFFIYTEEIDLCRRLQDQGWQLYWVPGAAIVHHGGASTSQVGRPMFVELYRSKVQYFRKHFGLRGVIGYKAVLAAAALTRVGLASVAMAVQPAKRAKWRALLADYSVLLVRLNAL